MANANLKLITKYLNYLIRRLVHNKDNPITEHNTLKTYSQKIQQLLNNQQSSTQTLE